MLTFIEIWDNASHRLADSVIPGGEVTRAEKTRNEHGSLLFFAFKCSSEASFLAALKSKNHPPDLAGGFFLLSRDAGI